MNYIATALDMIPEFQDGIKNLWVRKPTREIFLKAAEEMFELGLKLIQAANTASLTEKVSPEDIREEMVDVNMHLQLLEKFMYVGNDFHKREMSLLDTKAKVIKMLNSDDYKKYVK